MKTNKMLLRIGPKTVLQRTLDNINSSKVNGITVVLGSMHKEITASIAGYNVEHVYNPRYVEGMGTSLSLGVRSITERKKCDAIMFFNGDMPFIKTTTIDKIIEKFLKTKAPVIFPYCNGKRGHPVLVDKTVFPDLLELSGDIGARTALQKYEYQSVSLDTEDSGIYQDIDSPEDYQDISKYSSKKN